MTSATRGGARTPGGERVLVLRALGLGDLLTAVPALRATRRAFSGREVVLATAQHLQPLVHLGHLADTVVDSAGPDPVTWSGPPPSVAVNLHGRGPQSHRSLLGLRPGRMLAFGNASAGHAGPRWSEAEHEVDRWCRMLREYGVPADPLDLRLPTPERPPRVTGATIVHPGAGRPDKRWPADRFAIVAAGLARAGHHVVVTGDESERQLAVAVCERAGLPASRVLAGELDLAQLAALVASARLVVCGDTGVGHLATAFATTSVLLFGPEDPAVWGPRDRTRHLVVRAPGGSLAAITASDVREALSCWE